MSTHEVFSSSVELFDVPDQSILVREICDMTDGRFKGWAIDIRGDRNNNLDVVGNRSALELRLCFDHVLDSRVFMRLNDSFNPNEWFYMCIQAVRH